MKDCVVVNFERKISESIFPPTKLSQSSNATDGKSGVRALQQQVSEAMSPPKPVPPPELDATAGSKPQGIRSGLELSNRGRLIKTVMALAILAILAIMPSLRLLSTTSAEAVINARVITLRTPISGVISPFRQAFQVGTLIDAGDNILMVEDERADRNRMDDLFRSIATLETNRAAIAAQASNLEVEATKLLAHAADFKAARVQQLEWRVKEIHSEINAALARQVLGQKSLERSLRLAEAGHTPIARLEQATENSKVQDYALDALRHRLRAEQVALSAARSGISISDSHNDRSRSAEQAEVIRRQLRQLRVELAERDGRIKILRSELQKETEHHRKLAEASMIAPVRASVWEVLTAPGETVRAGQELVRLLDCGGAVVTASVSEAAYNNLRVGSAARFKPRGDNTELEGKIISLAGLAAAPSNLAIRPSILEREPYRVTISIPQLGDTTDCKIGRSGVVTFAGERNWFSNQFSRSAS